MLRESMRLLQHELPWGYDYVLVVRPHDPLSLAEYQKLLKALTIRGHEHWSKTTRGRN
jgi:RNase P protein component